MINESRWNLAPIEYSIGIKVSLRGLWETYCLVTNRHSQHFKRRTDYCAGHVARILLENIPDMALIS